MGSDYKNGKERTNYIYILKLLLHGNYDGYDIRHGSHPIRQKSSGLL